MALSYLLSYSVTQLLTYLLSDKGTYRAVRGQLKIFWIWFLCTLEVCVDSIAVSLFGWSKQIQNKSSPNRETAAVTPPTLMRNFQQASTQWKVLESGVSWLISPPMHLNSLLDGLLGVFFFTKCQETSSKLEGDSLRPSNLGKRWIGFVSTAFHISFQWESPFLHHNWLPSNLGKCSIGFVWAANHISFCCDCWKVSKN